MADALARLKSADQGNILSPKLFRRPGPLEKLIDEYGENAIDTIVSVVHRLMIDGTRRVNSWDYFEGAIRDADLATRREAGIRPGDFLGKGANLPLDIPF